MHKIGQVTQEVLSMYGFVLLAVIMILVSFVYFDVGKLSFLKRKDTCAFHSQIECEDSVYDPLTQNLSLMIRNKMDFSLYNVTLEAKGSCQGVGWNEIEEAIAGIQKTAARIFTIPCPLAKGSHELFLTLNFSTDGVTDYQKQGYLKVSVP